MVGFTDKKIMEQLVKIVWAGTDVKEKEKRCVFFFYAVGPLSNQDLFVSFLIVELNELGKNEL